MTAPEVSETGCVVRRSRYRSFDPRYTEEFNELDIRGEFLLREVTV